MQKPDPLAAEPRDRADAGDVAARSVQAGDQAGLTGSAPKVKTIGIVAVAALAAIGGEAACCDHRHLAADRSAANPAAGHSDRPPSETRSPRAGPRQSRIRSVLGGTPSRDSPRSPRRYREEPDHRHRRLLRARRERPRRRRAAEQRDELAPLSFDHLVGAGEQRRRYCRGRAPWRWSD